MMQKLLLIDSSDAVEATLRAQFDPRALILVRAAAAEPVLELVAVYQPDTIVIRAQTPIVGLEVCRLIKSTPATMHIPLLMLGHAVTVTQRVSAMDHGAIDYVNVDADAQELGARVRSALRAKYLLDLLARKAMLDGLTGLWNRSYFDARLAAEASLAKRSATPLSLIMVDLDRFKSMNDTHGHVLGDEMLRAVGERLAELGREEDIVCRYGGEEFALITPGSSAAAAAGLAERIGAAIRAMSWSHNGEKLTLTCSVGVAQHDPARSSSLLTRADHALYQAKQWGRNRVVVAEPLSAETSGLVPPRAA